MGISTIFWVLGALWLLGAASTATQRSNSPLRTLLDSDAKEQDRLLALSIRQQNEDEPWWNSPS